MCDRNPEDRTKNEPPIGYFALALLIALGLALAFAMMPSGTAGCVSNPAGVGVGELDQSHEETAQVPTQTGTAVEGSSVTQDQSVALNESDLVRSAFRSIVIAGAVGGVGLAIALAFLIWHFRYMREKSRYIQENGNEAEKIAEALLWRLAADRYIQKEKH